MHLSSTLALICTAALGATAGEALPPKQDPAAIPESAYVRATPEGQLTANGQRQRFWAVIGGYPNMPGFADTDTPEQRAAKLARSRADSAALVQRFTDLGFNMGRMWHYSEAEYVPGDGSASDVVDHFVALAKQAGMRLWIPGVSHVNVTAADVGGVDEPATAPAWTAAMEEGKGFGLLWFARVWDPRMEAAQHRAITRRVGHFNHHTGLRWADDPVFAIWELTNEEWWFGKMRDGAWRGLPPYFKNALLAKWQSFLKAKYSSQDKLLARWGFLFPGEALDGAIGLLPMANAQKLDDAGMDPTAKKALEAALAAGASADVGRDQVVRARGEDVAEFFLSLQLAHKKRLGDHLKSLGRSATLSPLTYDAGIGYEIQSQFLHQQADAVSHDAYINGTARSVVNQRFPWLTGLEEAPRIAHDVPWLEHNKTPGKPYFCYETQIQQPAKYRAEFPLRLAALYAIQDWDAACWHYWGGVGDITTNPRPFDKALDVTVGGHPQGYHYTFDEVQNAMMRAGGYLVRQSLVKPAPTPTTFIYGRRSLYDPASFDYGRSYGPMGQHMLPTTYQHGVRILIDPKREDDEVKGPYIRLDGEGSPAVIKPNEQITFDTLRGGLTFNAPGVAAFTGFQAHFGDTLDFSASGTVLKGVQVVVPPGMPYADGLAEERYIGFALYSTDGKPLAESKAMSCSLVCSSFNTGFKLGQDNDGKPIAGTLPVLVARVAGTVVSKALAGAAYTLRDWHNQPIGKGTVGADGALAIPADKPVWVVELTR